MKKITLYLFALLTGMAFVACSDPFAGQFIAEPGANEQGELQPTEGFSFVLGSDFAAPVTLSTQDVADEKLFEAVKTATTSPKLVSEMASIVFTLVASDTEDFANTVSLASTSENNAAVVSAAALASVIEEFYNRAPATRDLFIRVSAAIVDDRIVLPLPTQTVFGAIKVITDLISEEDLTLFVPGSHQGWNPATAPTLFTRNFDFVYTGYVSFNADDLFKFTAQPDWGPTEYGDGGNGTLVTSGGGNISVADAGQYQITVDLSVSPYTYAMVKTEWGLIGEATPGGWGGSTPMTFNPATGLWTVTTTLSAGEYKFRANNSWDINIGGDLTDLSYNGGNLSIAEAGTYTITLDLTNPQTYRATVVKQ